MCQRGTLKLLRVSFYYLYIKKLNCRYILNFTVELYFTMVNVLSKTLNVIIKIINISTQKEYLKCNLH